MGGHLIDRQSSQRSAQRSGGGGRGVQRIGTVVVGGGQAGLTAAYYLRRAGESFVVLDAGDRVGQSWRDRYDSLRLFSRPRWASLPGWRIPTRDCPTRDEMADYLERYAARFQLPVALHTRVARVSRTGAEFLVETNRGSYVADQVIVAAGAHHRAGVPAFAAEVDPSVRQLHSLDYRGPAQLAAGDVLVVGAGNSGTDIALEATAHGHRTLLAGRHPGQVPVDIDSTPGRLVTPVVMFAFKHVLTRRTPMGRAQIAKAEGRGVNLVRNKLAHLDAAGIVRLGRITGVADGRPVTADGAVPAVSTIVWCTGSTPDHGWLDLPVFDAAGRPRHRRGIAADEPGLFFLGLDLQFAIASGTIQGLDRDARYVVRELRRRTRSRTRAGDAAGQPALAA